MRFKAKLAPEQLSLFSQLIVPLARIAGSSNEAGWTKNGSVLYLDNEHLRLCVKGKANDAEDIRCFAELVAKDGIFLEHRIESAAENNAIVMEVDLSQFKIALLSLASGGKSSSAAVASHQTLESAFTSAMIHIKLAKRNSIPCLCFDAITQGSVQVHYSLPVRIMRPGDMQYHLPPPILSTTNMLQLELPRDKPLKPVLEGIRPLSNTVILHATAKGDLTVTVDTDGAMIRTFYSHLPVIEIASPDGGDQGYVASTRKRSARVKVDTKKLVACLQWQWSMVSSARICLIENDMVLLHVRLHPKQVGSLSYYIPVQYLNPDDADYYSDNDEDM